MVLFDDAAQSKESYTIVPLIFDPKVFLLFGDSDMKTKDRLNLETYYPGYRYTQSLFERLLNNQNSRIVMQLKNQHRFSSKLDSLFTENMWRYNNVGSRKFSIDESFFLKHFYVLHQRNDDFMINFISDIVSIRDNKFSFGIITPPGGSAFLNPMQVYLLFIFR